MANFTPSDTPLRVGIVGAGWMGKTHAEAWSMIAPRATIAAVSDVTLQRARDLSDLYTEGTAAPFDSLDAMLASGDVDAVDICLPHHLHTDAILTAASAGKHVMCEKPLCLTLHEAKTIRDRVGEAGVTFMAAHNNLFAPALVEARRLLEAGTLGQVHFIRSTEAGHNVNYKTGRPPTTLAPGESSWAWRQDVSRSGGGVVIDTGWHGAYRLLALAGSRPVEVTAMLADYYINAPDAEDTGTVLVRFESGATGVLFTSWAFGEPPGGYQFQVGAEQGTLGGTATKLVYQRFEESPVTQEFERLNTFAQEVGHFVDIVRHGATSLATWEHAARTLQLILGAYRAAAERCTVTLPEDPTSL
ncbi:MAG TPA: Gfo/Idh/MocA family oxidoreductase [Chloroflexota bacterium]|nr:Gfo/Idh/MocA family oxidoreductase [Chloroflexota bacterium]